MKFCKYCGKQIPTGETCSCQKQEDTEVVEESVIDLGLTDDVEISTEAKPIEIKEMEDKEYKYCSNCGKRILDGEICSCQKEEIVKETIVNDSVNSIKGLFSNFFKDENNSISVYLKNVSINTSILIITIFLISSLLFSCISYISNNTIEVFGHYQLMVNTMDIIIYVVKEMISNILEVVLFTVTLLISLKYVLKKDITIKDTFNITALSYIPVILFSIIGFIFGILNIKLVGTINTIGLICSILLIERAIKAFKVDENKIFISLVSIISIVTILNNIINLIIK